MCLLVSVAGQGQFRALRGLFKASKLELHNSARTSSNLVIIDMTATFYPRLLPHFCGATIRSVDQPHDEVTPYTCTCRG
jgi:hypothetical protein